MKDGAILANSGHFNVEIDIPSIIAESTKKRTMREFVEEYTFSDGRRIYILGEGRLVNLAAAEGHPAQVMDMSFANQALSVEYILAHHAQLKKDVYKVPDRIDEGSRHLSSSPWVSPSTGLLSSRRSICPVGKSGPEDVARKDRSGADRQPGGKWSEYL